MDAYRAMASAAKEDLTAPEYLAAIWARKALPYDLLDDPMFRQQFNPCIPPGFNRKKLSEEMHTLAGKVNERVYKKLGKCFATIGVDGWTNTRHHKMYNIVLVAQGEAYFIDSVETGGNFAERIFRVVKDAKVQLEARGIIVVAVVGDNHAPLQNALNR